MHGSCQQRHVCFVILECSSAVTAQHRADANSANFRASSAYASGRSNYCMVFPFLSCIPRTSRAVRVGARTSQIGVQLVQCPRTSPRPELLWAVRGIYVKVGVGGATQGAGEVEVDEVDEIRERIWDAWSGGIAAPLPSLLLTTN